MTVIYLSLFLILLLHSLRFATADPLYYACEGGNYTANSAYPTNLHHLLNYFTSLGSNTTFATHTTNSTYGLFLCRGDVGPTDCTTCIQNAARDILSLCPTSFRATVWYDYCELRYSDRSFFSAVDQSNGQILYNGINAMDPTGFVQLENELVGKVTNQAALNSSKELFATGTAINGSLMINGLAQCTRDISAVDCNQCLQNITQEYWDLNGLALKVGGRFIGKNCNFRYETYPFYNGKPTIYLNFTPSPSPPPAPPLLPPNPPKEQEQEKKKLDTGSSSSNTGLVLAIVIPSAAGFILFLAMFIYFWRKRAAPTQTGITDLEEISNVDSLLFDLSVLKVATDNFSESSKLGQGGFGSVYKGTLSDGREIAVKRLAIGSTQGEDELKNELFLVAKLQHRNLVRLCGVCLEEGEKLLVYEYAPNRSLDNFLFDPIKSEELNWARRFNIIGGIARGLLYLHEESYLKVVHRDLKASNVLLDADMNPKISDFGLARLFGGDETQEQTSRVVGTFGYMSPEYALHGHISTKVDVYSFGVIALEIVTGRKNSSFLGSQHNQDILSYVWEFWSDGKVLDIMDPSLDETNTRNEVMRCIHISLLCVQENPTQRPPMSSVVLMLHSPSVPLEAPLEPRLIVTKTSQVNSDTSGKQNDSGSANCATDQTLPISVNEVSITDLYPR